MRQRRIGCGGLLVGAVGLDCRTLAGPGEEHAVGVIRAALDRGLNLLDTADVYGSFTNELLLGRAIAGRRRDAVVATKIGLAPAAGAGLVRDGRPEHVRAACDGSLRRLGTERVDLCQLHRVDPAVPIEETWGAMAELVGAGKVRALGLCGVSVAQLRRAQHVFPVTSVRAELSLWARTALDSVLPWCRSHGVGLLAAAPLGRPPGRPGTGAGAGSAAPPGLRAVAERHAATPAQVALAWVLAQGDGVAPLLDLGQGADLAELAAAAELELDAADLLALNEPPVETPPAA